MTVPWKPLALGVGWGVVLGSAEHLGLPVGLQWALRGFFLLSLSVAVLSRGFDQRLGRRS